MVIRILGGMLVVLPSGLLGFYWAGRYTARHESLKEMASALQSMETRIEYVQTPLPRIFVRLAGEMDGESARFFHTMCELLENNPGLTPQEVWTRALFESEQLNSLTDQDKKILADCGQMLGQTDPEHQIRHLRLARDLLERSRKDARRACNKNVRLFRYLGFLAGMLVLLLLL